MLTKKNADIPTKSKKSIDNTPVRRPSTTPPSTDPRSTDDSGSHALGRVKPFLLAPILPLFIVVLNFGMRFLPDLTVHVNNTDSLYIILILLQIVVIVLPGIFYCKLRGSGFALRLRLRLPSPNRVAFGVLGLFLILFGTAIIKSAYVALGTGYNNLYFLNLYGYISQANLSTVSDAVYSIITFAIVPAIATEFVYRGILVREYADGGYGPVCAVFFSALLYASLASSPKTVPILFYTGLVLGIVFFFTHSLLYSMLISAVLSVCDLFGETFLLHVAAQRAYSVLLFFLLVTAFLVVLLLTVREAERILHNEGVFGAAVPSYLRTETSQKAAFGMCLISPSLLLCIAVTAVKLLWI